MSSSFSNIKHMHRWIIHNKIHLENKWVSFHFMPTSQAYIWQSVPITFNLLTFVDLILILHPLPSNPIHWRHQSQCFVFLSVCNMMHDSFSTTQVTSLQEAEITEHGVSEKIWGNEGLYLLTLWPENNKRMDYYSAKTYGLCAKSTI